MRRTRLPLPLLLISLPLVAACGSGGGGGIGGPNSNPVALAPSTAAMETATRSGILGLKPLVRAIVDAAQSPTLLPNTNLVQLGGDLYRVLAGADGRGLAVNQPKGVLLASADGLKWADVTIEERIDGTIELVGELKTGAGAKHKLIFTGVRFTYDPRVFAFDPVGDAQDVHVVRYDPDGPIEEANGFVQFSGDGTVYMESTLRVIADGREAGFIVIAPLN